MQNRKSPADKIAALQDKLNAAKAEAKAAQQKRYALLGETISDFMNADPEFRTAVITKLKTVTNPKSKADLASFIVT